MSNLGPQFLPGTSPSELGDRVYDLDNPTAHGLDHWNENADAYHVRNLGTMRTDAGKGPEVTVEAMGSRDHNPGHEVHAGTLKATQDLMDKDAWASHNTNGRFRPPSRTRDGSPQGTHLYGVKLDETLPLHEADAKAAGNESWRLTDLNARGNKVGGTHVLTDSGVDWSKHRAKVGLPLDHGGITAYLNKSEDRGSASYVGPRESFQSYTDAVSEDDGRLPQAVREDEHREKTYGSIEPGVPVVPDRARWEVETKQPSLQYRGGDRRPVGKHAVQLDMLNTESSRNDAVNLRRAGYSEAARRPSFLEQK